VSAAASGPDVLVISAHVGAGHTQAARAIVEALQAQAPHSLDIEHLELLELLRPAFDLYYNRGYMLAMSRLGWLYGMGYRLSDRPQGPRRSVSERLKLAWEALWLGPLRRYLLERPPRLIVHTHFLAPPAVGRLVRSGRLDSRQMIALTDVHPHRWWFAEGIERWFVAGETARRRVAGWGYADERIVVSGIPVRAKWRESLDGARIRRQWSLPAEGPVVLLTGGTEFVCGPVARMARDIARACPAAVVVVLCGRNRGLLEEVASLAEAAEGRIRAVAYTERAHELVEAAALMVTKAGGISTAECLARRTPMVLHSPVPGQEAGNAAYLAASGAARIARGPARVVHTVRELLAEPARLGEMAQAADRLDRPAERTIAGEILHALETESAADG
jgi:processive 1,2-diacylglycerol beta-glucosyltransferase